jgi:hypothetical protein
MGFHHWWWGFFTDENEYTRLLPYFTEAAKKAVLSPKSQQAFDAWRRRPSDFEQDALTEETAAQINAFIWAFNLPGFNELAYDLLAVRSRTPGFDAGFDIEARFFRWASTAKNTPVSIIWHALGYERASLLPGRMGNMLLHPREIADAKERVCRAYAGTSPQNLLDAAKCYCDRDVSDERLRHDVISFLPDGLARAEELRLGFLALARPQI